MKLHKSKAVNFQKDKIMKTLVKLYSSLNMGLAKIIVGYVYF